MSIDSALSAATSRRMRGSAQRRRRQTIGLKLRCFSVTVGRRRPPAGRGDRDHHRKAQVPRSDGHRGAAGRRGLAQHVPALPAVLDARTRPGRASSSGTGTGCIAPTSSTRSTRSSTRPTCSRSARSCHALFAIPGAKSAASRVLNGRLYLADVPFTDPGEEDRRLPEFARRAGHYFDNWDDLGTRWIAKLEGLTAELQAIAVPTLPDLEPERSCSTAAATAAVTRCSTRGARRSSNLFLCLPVPLRDAGAGLRRPAELPGLLQGRASRHLRADVGRGSRRASSSRQFRPDEELKRLARLALDLGLGTELALRRAGRHPRAG